VLLLLLTVVSTWPPPPMPDTGAHAQISTSHRPLARATAALLTSVEHARAGKTVSEASAARRASPYGATGARATRVSYAHQRAGTPPPSPGILALRLSRPLWPRWLALLRGLSTLSCAPAQSVRVSACACLCVCMRPRSQAPPAPPPLRPSHRAAYHSDSRPISLVAPLALFATHQRKQTMPTSPTCVMALE
jgi:hypothetical protein